MFEVGSSLGKYRIRRMIGRGGMGTVYLAEDSLLGREIALKVLDHRFSLDGQFERRFKQEARAIAGLDHPHIVKIHSLEQIQDCWVIDMPHMKRGALTNSEHAGVITLHQVLQYMLQILDALACCHEAGTIHRDVKPNNILIASDDAVVLSDFGLSKLLAEYHSDSVVGSSSSGIFLGTPRYAPPESWDGQEPTPAWDVYSAGMVIYEAAASGPPYDAATPMALVKQMAARPIPPLHTVCESVSQELSDAVADMLDFDPSRRPRNGREAHERLCAVPELQTPCESDSPTVVGRKGASGTRVRIKAPRPLRERKRTALRTAVSLAAILLVCLALAGAYWWNAGGRIPESARTPALPVKVLESLSSSSFPPAKDASLFFDALDPATQAITANECLVRSGNDGEWSALAMEDTRLWYVKGVEQESNKSTLEGYWAEYGDDTARIFRHGTLSGTARWLGADKGMPVSLQCVCSQDASTFERSFVWRIADKPTSEQDFVRSLEEARVIQDLLYRELVPRAAPWVDDVETRFLSLATPRAFALRAPAEGVDSIKIDGRLDEPLWKAAHATEGRPESNMLPSGLPNGSGRLAFVQDDNNLYLGLTLPLAGASPVITVALLDRFGMPVTQSSRWTVVFSSGAVVSRNHTAREKDVPWNETWTCAESASEGVWQAEIAIPCRSLGRNGVPKPGERWRLNCTVAAGGSANAKTLARWGDQDPARVEHGVLLIFGQGTK